MPALEGTELKEPSRGDAEVDERTRDMRREAMEQVREATKFVRAYAASEGPIMVEMDTYRYHGHSMSDPGITYRSREEVSGVRQARDPVATVKNWLLNEAGATADEIKAMETSVRKHIDAAVEDNIDKSIDKDVEA